MQVKKDDIRKRILIVAKEEFFEHGFKNTSMRVIAKKAGVGLSNIYNYFKNKNEMFLEILNPLLSIVDEMMNSHSEDDSMTLDYLVSKEFQTTGVNMMISLVENFRKELKLLLFHSYGSSLENFRDEYIEKSTIKGIEFLRNMQKKYPNINTDVSPFFLRNIGAWSLAIMGELVTHQNLSHKELEKFMADYVAFVSAGWKELMKV